MDDRKVKELSVEGVLHRIQPTKHFVYSVRVTWSDGMVNVVYRRYKQFLDLEKQLLDAFPNKKESIPTLRTKSPSSPGTAIKYVDEIAVFVETLINLPTLISSCVLVLEFFTLTEQDLTSAPRNGEKKSKKETLERKNEINTKKRKKKGHRRGRFTRRMKTLKDGLISGPVVFEQYTVLEAYKKQNKNDINLTEGQIVEVIEKRDNGWWFVEADEQLGWAPASFLQTTDLDVEDDFIITRFPRGKGEIYMTTKSYKATMQDELSFDIGVNLQIVERNYGGWWRAIYMGKEGYVPAAYLQKIGSGRHSVLQRNTREKKISVVSRLEESILEESGADNVSLHSSFDGTIQRRNYDPYAPMSEMQNRKISNSNPHWRHSLPPQFASRSAPGSPERRAKHHTLQPLGRPTRSLSNLASPYSSTKQLTSPLTFSENFMGSGKRDQVDADESEERAVSSSGSEGNPTLSEATSLSSLNRHKFAADEPPEFSQKGLAESDHQIHEEGRWLENEVNNGDQTDSDEADTDSEEEEDGDDREDRILQAFDNLPSPPRAPPQNQGRRARQARTTYKAPADIQADNVQSSYTECYEQTFSREPSSSIQESECSSDEEAEGAIDISELRDNPQQILNQQTFQVIASYEGDESCNELTLTEGEIVEIIQQKANGWWLALGHRQTGWVPSNYLEPLSRETQEHIPSDTQTEDNENAIETRF